MIKKIALSVASLLFVALVAEVVLRLVWLPPHFKSDPCGAAHPVYSAAPLPGQSGITCKAEFTHSFRHSKQGLRMGHELTKELPAGKKQRLLFLGDSFTYGNGVDDDSSFVARVASALPHVEVVNGGWNGRGQREELAVLDCLGAALRPDLTVVCFFWNDLDDNLRRTVPAFAVRGGKVVRDDPVPAGFDPLAPWECPIPSRPSAWSVSFFREFLRFGFDALKMRVWGIKTRFIRTEEQRREAWQITESYLSMMRLRCEDFGGRLAVVWIPDHNQVDASAKIAGIGEFQFDVRGELAAICARLGLPLVEPLGSMRAAFERGRAPLYYYVDRHLNGLGNEALAAAILPELRAHLDASEMRR